jgi:Double zinc ribbon
MKCPRCQHENPPLAKFCLECGARVALTCTKCRSELPPAGAKFCLEWGRRSRHGQQPNLGSHRPSPTATTMCREMDMRCWLEQAEAELNVLR